MPINSLKPLFNKFGAKYGRSCTSEQQTSFKAARAVNQRHTDDEVSIGNRLSLRTFERRHSNGCSSRHSAGGNGNHGLRCFGDGTTLQRLRHMPRRPVRATRLPVFHGTQTVNKASEDGISMTCIYRDRRQDDQAAATALEWTGTNS